MPAIVLGLTTFFVIAFRDISVGSDTENYVNYFITGDYWESRDPEWLFQVWNKFLRTFISDVELHM